MKALLLLAFAGIPLVAHAGDREYEGEYSYDDMAGIYEWVCAAMEEQYESETFYCPPQPVIALAETQPGLWGYHYRGSQIIWVSTRLALQPLSVFGEAIIAHEMVHYVLSEFNDLQPQKDACRNEAVAWEAYNRYVEEYGFMDLINESWWDNYSNCEGPDADYKITWAEFVEQIQDTLEEITNEKD